MIPLPDLNRRMSVPVRVGQHVVIGGGAPVLLQAMTDAPTRDVEKAAAQVKLLADAGAELVRLTVDTEESAKAVPHIRDRLRAQGCLVPLAGCFHYNGHTLLQKHPACAEALDKYRINPGNVGFGAGKDARFAAIIETAARYGKAVRIGVNWGSLDQALAQALMDENAASASPAPADAVTREALVRSALESARRAEQLGLGADRIVLSCKVSRAPDLIAVTRALAARGPYALHLGLTEAGSGYEGAASSAAALSVLLSEGLGDTVRVSLTPKPGESRTSEVIIGRSILQALGLRSFAPDVTACPGCGRTESALFRELAEQVKSHLEEALPRLRARYPGSEGLKVAVMGCIVNGPGESKHADIGISLPGTGEDPSAPVFEDGAKTATLRGPKLADEFIGMVERYVERRWG